MHLKKHFLDSKDLLRSISPDDIAKWLFDEGYFPERYVLPPSFKVSGLALKTAPYYHDLSSLPRRQIQKLSYPKSMLTDRQFGIIHPWNYHDIVYHLHDSWNQVVNHLYPKEQGIYSYSLPIPITRKHPGRLGQLRAGRLIYEWLAMAEKDLILDAGAYRYIARTDISSFYGSVYTHSIPWALHGRDEAREDRYYNLLGSKIDRLLQYSNDGRTNGIPIGPALTDLIAEIILAAVDREVSRRLNETIDFVGARFKDDYRFLCQSEEDGRNVLQCLADVLCDYNLVLNERKTSILKLPDGLYRIHDREYFPHSLARQKTISFKTFEHTLLIALDIHRRNPGTSILEKFVNELLDREKSLKVEFSFTPSRKLQEIKKMVELLFFAKRESQKLLCHILAVCEQLYLANRKQFADLKPFFRDRITYEMKVASDEGSTFEIVWYIFFSRLVGIGITDFSIVDNDNITKNAFYKSAITSAQKIFNDSEIDLFIKPRYCKGLSLAKQIAVFD